MGDGNLWKYSKDKLECDFVRKSIDLPLISPPNGHENHNRTHDAKYTYRCEIKTSVGDDSKKVINPLKICIGKRLRTSDDDEYSEIKRRSLSQNECKQSEPQPLNRTLCNPSQLKKIKAAKDVPNNVNDKSIPKIANPHNAQNFKKQLPKGSHLQNYADYLGLQQTVKFKCRKCCTMSFKSLAVLKEHQRVCCGQADTLGTPPEASTSGRTTRKVYLCSACGTYFENWNLFLHMREVHNRHICLCCLGMFARAEKLAAHLSAKHNVVEMHYDTAAQFLETNSGSLYLMCCSCDTVYTEKDNFSSHECKAKEPKIQSKQPTANNNSLTKKITSKDSNSIELETNTKLTIEQSDKLAPKEKETTLNNTASTKTLDEGTFQRLEPLQERNCSDTSALSEKNDTIKTNDTENNTSSDLNSTLSNPDISRDSFSSPLKLEDLEITPPKEDKKIDSDSLDISGKTPEFEPPDHLNQINLQLDVLNRGPSPPKALPVVEPASIITQSPLLTSLLMKESPVPNFNSKPPPPNLKLPPPNLNLKPPPIQQPINSQYNLYNEGCNLLNNNITVEKSKEPGIKLKFNLQNASSPVIISSNYNRSGQSAPTTVKPPNRTRRPPKRFDDSPPATPTPPPAPPVTTLKTTIYDIHPMQTDILNRVPKLTVRVPREILEKQFSSDSSDSEEENKLTMDLDESLNKEPFIQKADTTVEEQPTDEQPIAEHPANVQDSIQNEETEKLDVDDVKIPPDKSELPDDIENEEIDKPPEIELPLSELKLNQPLDKYPLKELLKICVAATMWNCIYCNHVRKIAVNCKALSLHILENHRFSATVDSITAEELLPETINLKIKNELDECESVFINLSSFDNADKTECDVFDHIFECFQCYFKTPAHKELYFHNRKMHQKAILICYMCKSNFYSYSELLCHLCPGNIGSEQEIHYRCCFCRVDNIPSSFRLMVHLRKIHHTCEVCLERCWNQTKLSMHVWKHKLHHLCYRCGIAYRNKPDITKHLFWKHGTESIICKKCMQKKWPHIYHFCIPPVTFVCEECKLSFTKAVSLRVHKRFHVAEFPHMCTEKDCNEMFVSKKLLEKHAEKHKPLVIDLTPNDDVLNMDAPNALKQETAEKKEDNPTNEATAATDTVASKDTNLDLSNKKSKKKRNKDKDLLLDVNLPELNLSESDSSDEESEDASATNKETEKPKIEIIKSEETHKLEPEVNINKLDVSNSEEIKKGVCENEKQTTEQNKEIPKTDLDPTNTEEISLPTEEGSESKKKELTEKDKNESHDTEKFELEKPEKQEPSDMKIHTVSSPVEENTNNKIDNKEKESNSSDSKPVEAESKELKGKEGTELDNSNDLKKESEEKIEPKNKEIEDEKKRSEQQVLEIWDNFKQYQAQVEREKSPERPKTPPLVTIRKHVCESDHDYCLIPVETNGDQPDRKLKKKKWRRSRSRSVSSSSSSSNSGSSCSCGSNCSCSSSGSSSSSSDNEAYVLEDRRVDKSKRKMAQRRESQVSIDVTAPEDTPVLVPEVKEPEIAESDLQTEESDTDEDFYDEHPQKLANKMYTEKHNRLMMLATVASSDTPEATTFGLIDDTVSQLPPVPEEQATDVKKKRKAKRRKKQKSPKKKPQKPIKLNIPKQKFLPPLEYTPPPVPLAPNKITISLHSNTVQIGNPPDVTTTPKSYRPIDQDYLTSEQRASKRRRRPNKFYGYNSDEETRSKVIVREPFNPYLPPKFEWKKEDLPAPTSSHRIPTHSIMEPSIRLTAPVTDPVPPQILMNSESEESSDSDSSGGQFHISQTDHCFTPSYPQPIEEPITEPRVQTFSNNEDSLYNPENSGNPFPSFMPQSTQSLVAQNPYASHLFRFRRPQGMRPAREGESVYCYCRCPYDEVSEMIGCDAPACSIEWFHFECVGIMVPPKGKWYCPDCKIRMGMV